MRLLRCRAQRTIIGAAYLQTMRTARLLTAFAATLALALSGCAGHDVMPAPSASVAPSISPDPTTESSPEPTAETPDEPSTVGGCAGLPGLQPRADGVDDRVYGYWYAELRDTGPAANANGTTTLDDAGQPASYVAASGDTMYAIAARFCIDFYPYLEWINGIRRGDNTEVLGTGNMLVFEGDTINLSPYTVASVGDQNGVVYDNDIQWHIPQQR